MNSSKFVDVTSELHNVTGGAGRGELIKNGLKAAYKGGRAALKETADVVKDLGVIGAAGYGAKKMWDSMSGGGSQPPAGQE